MNVPSQTLYIQNLNEKTRKQGERCARYALRLRRAAERPCRAARVPQR
jgi:hypothetical protein